MPLALLDKGFYSLKQDEIKAMLSSLSPEDILKIWQRALEEKSSQLSEDILTAALPHLTMELPDTAKEIANWLKSSNWDKTDDDVLREANKANPKLFYELERAFAADEDAGVFRRVQSVIGPVNVDLNTKKEEPADISAKPYKNPWWLNVLLGGAMFILFELAPIDIPGNLSILQIWLGRGIQLLAFLTGLFALLSLAVWLFSLTDRENKNFSKNTRKWSGILIPVFLLVTIGCYWLLENWHYPLTLRGQILSALILAGVYIVPVSFEWLIRTTFLSLKNKT